MAIAAMLLAAIAFSNGTTISIPFLATFDGFRGTSTSPSVTISGSWIAAAVVAVILTLPLSVVAFRTNRETAE
ncbi:hypothetical protein [Salinibacterium sp. NK8237]|uniref:hypothetical protein n=1 Tax=Salinibacterium sp. NK8237 TaxID=2792038 RepID=UPI0018CF1AA0|nr:hypothetical protein [Salinibacterium sp. NK8237]MBH0129973.1 hypothetical protein [Salinibacterium sp. NK8237]